MDGIEEIRAKAEHTKAKLDEIDAMIDKDPDLIYSPELMRARSQYSNEWIKLVEVIRKTSTGQQAPEQRKGKLDGIRGQLKVVSAV